MKKTKYICAVAEELLDIRTGEWKAYPLVIDNEKCKKCGTCVLYCPVNSITRIDGNYVIKPDYCKGCGVCKHECPAGAIYIDKGGAAV